MFKIKVCFGIASDNSGKIFQEKYEQNYENSFKSTVSFLYAHKNCPFSFSFLGEQLEWFRKKHPEFLELIRKLISRKQIEILGGGYYNPAFPLLFPMDRSGQIEFLSSEIRQITGKRPRGMSLCASIWDPSLTACFQSCGMEFIQLDSSLIPPEKNFYLPLIQSERGKTLNVIPVYRELKPAPKEFPDDYVKRLYETVFDTCTEDDYTTVANYRIISIVFGKNEFGQLLDSGWFQKVVEIITNKYQEKIELSTPLNAIRNSQAFIQAYIPAGLSADISQWALKPYTSVVSQPCFPTTIQDFLVTYPRNRALYNRMIYVSMLVNQCHGDKMRKKNAREKLWEAQNGTAFICTPKGTLANFSQRHRAYLQLSEAEKIVRECTDDFQEFVTNFDYNTDGIKEYICQMKLFDACIGLLGGVVEELIMCKTGNYCDNPERIKKFDGYTDIYNRGLFVDHLCTDEDFINYKTKNVLDNSAFTGKRYNELKFSGSHKEIHLNVQDTFINQQVSLRKKFIVTSNGFIVQYILKNESDATIKGKYIIENNLAQKIINENLLAKYNIEVISNTEKKELFSEKTYMQPIEYNNVSLFQITDIENKVCFVFEPNESAEFICSQIVFKRPKSPDFKISDAAVTLVLSLVWDIDLLAGREIEKTINFNIITAKRKRSRKPYIE